MMIELWGDSKMLLQTCKNLAKELDSPGREVQTLLRVLTIRSGTEAIVMARPRPNTKSAPLVQISCDPQIVCFKPEVS